MNTCYSGGYMTRPQRIMPQTALNTVRTF